jgi:hypothetical protein
MSIFAEDLRTYIAASTAINQYTSTRIHYAQVPQSSAYPHVWFRITSDTEERTMDGAGGIHEAYVDLECAGLTQTSAQTVATALKDRLDGYAGTMGNSSCKACFLRDKDDDYIPFSNQSDEGVVVIAFTAHTWYST